MTENECAQARANIEELIRGEQCAGQREALMRHLDECDDCRSEEQVCHRLTEAVKRACAESAPQSLREAIRIGLRDLHRA